MHAMKRNNGVAKSMILILIVKCFEKSLMAFDLDQIKINVMSFSFLW